MQELTQAWKSDNGRLYESAADALRADFDRQVEHIQAEYHLRPESIRGFLRHFPEFLLDCGKALSIHSNWQASVIAATGKERDDV